MQELIQKQQIEIKNKIQSMSPTDNITYENIVIPSITLILDLLTKTPPSEWYVKHNIDLPIDIYAEALSVYMIQNKIQGLRIEIIAYVLINHPFMLNLIQEYHNNQTWNEYRQKLISIIDQEFSNYEMSKKIIKTLEINSTVDIANTSSFHLFHYLSGFTFTSDSIAKPLKELIPVLSSLMNESSIIISINAAYNVVQNESIICYHEIPKSKYKILSNETVGNYTTIYSYYGVNQEVSTPFDILDNEFNKLEQLPEYFKNAIVLINYNDTTNLINNHYTLARFGKFNTLTPNQAKEFIQYKLLYSLDHKLLYFYLKQSFYATIYDDTFDLNELKRQYTKLLNITSQLYNQNKPLSEFIDNLTEKALSEGIITTYEAEYFKTYLLKLNTIELSVSTVTDHVLSYIYPNLLTNSKNL